MLASLLNKRTLPFAVDCQMWKKQKTKNNIDSLHHIMCVAYKQEQERSERKSEKNKKFV
jgi:hypothetical protein